MGTDLEDMKSVSKFNIGFRFVLCVTDIYSKYTWVIRFKDKKGITIIYDFQKVLDKSHCKPNKIRVDKGSECYNRSMKSLVETNDIEIYSARNKGKYVVAERFMITIKNKFYKYMTLFSKNVYIDKLDGLVNKCNNTYHSAIKVKPVNIKSNTYIKPRKEINDQDPKFKIGYNIRISKYKNVFAKGYTLSWSEEAFVIKKVKNTVPWIYIINDLNEEKTVWTFYKNKLQKAIQKEFRIEKVINRRGDKFHVKRNRYNNSFNSWIDKKDIV